MHFHLVGIKGSGMSALAKILVDRGHKVEGSDVSHYVFTQDSLQAKKIKIFDFNQLNQLEYDCLIVGHNFINLEVVSDKKFIEYNNFLSNLIEEFTCSIAVCGTHGKTTTTGLVSRVVSLDRPTCYLIGDGNGIGVKENDTFVFEACEYKNHFLVYFPTYAIITNVDYDHVDYFKDISSYQNCFLNFCKNVKKKIIVNGDDDYLKSIAKDEKFVTFGLNKDNDYVAKNIQMDERGIRYEVNYFGVEETFFAPFYGKHMIYNTLSVIAICATMNIPWQKVINGISSFTGVNRRFVEKLIQDDVIIDDYAHHPKEIATTIGAIRQKYRDKKVVAIFKPDRYSRINSFAQEFAIALDLADHSYILDFPLETNDEGLTLSPNIIVDKMTRGVYLKEFDPCKIVEKTPSIYLFMGSKDIEEIKKNLCQFLLTK